MTQQPVKSAERVLDILELFRLRKTGLGVREIAEYFDYPKVSTSVLLKSMAAKGYLSYDRAAHSFYPTMRVALLGDWLPDSSDSGHRIEGLLRQLGGLTGETALLASRNDIWSQFLLVRPSRHDIQFFPAVGARRPLVWSGTGFTILAALDDAEIERIFRASRARLFKSELPEDRTLDVTFDEVRKVRENGYALVRNMTTPGAAVVAMKVPDMHNEAPMVVGVASIVDRFDDARLVDIVAMMKEVLARFE